MFVGWGALLFVCNILKDKELEVNDKLQLIYTRQLISAYTFLFISRLIILLVIIFWGAWWIEVLIMFGGCYMCLNFINIFGVFKKYEDDWNNKQTLYDLKQKYYVKREN